MPGGLYAQYQGNSDVNMGRGAIVIGLAAVIIGEVLGEASLANVSISRPHRIRSSRRRHLLCCYRFVLWLGLPSEDMKLFSAIVVAIFLAIPYLRGKSKTSFKRAAKNGGN